MAKSKLETDGLDRLKDARQQKEYIQLDIRECYFFADPRRQRIVSSRARPYGRPTQDAPELNTDLAFILTADFVTEVLNTYMPEAQLWCERGPGMGLPDGVFDKIKDAVKGDDRKIFNAMKASNLYSEMPKACVPDLAIGTAAIWIDRSHPSKPISVLAIPLRELEINLGPDGNIDDRFAVRWLRNAHVEAVLGKEIFAKVKPSEKKKLGSKSADRSSVAWGFWRLWDRADDECWQHVIYLNDELIHEAEIKGEGSCPLIPFRFRPVADWPHGIGPLMQSLPTLRQVDEWERQIPEVCERNANGPISYPDDSFSNVEQGFETSMAYPIRPGTEDAIKPIYPQVSMEPELVDLDRKEHRLRKLFFVDFPEQTGDTPPTLGQWLDEMARAQRRIGTPGQTFWREAPAQIFLRFKYLLEAAGAIQPIKVNGVAIALLPYNPAQRAAEQQEIATAFQCAQALAQMFPEGWRINIDDRVTMEKIIEKMRTNGLLQLRSPDDVKAAVAQISQLVGQGGIRQKAGAPVPEGAGAPAAA